MEAVVMESKAYEYMDWPRIEAVVYGEEASPKDVMAPRLTTDGVLIQGFFPEADKAEVLVGSRKYEMEQEDEAGYFAAMIPGRKIPDYKYRVTKGEETKEFADPYAFSGQITDAGCFHILYYMPWSDHRSRGKSFLRRRLLSRV